MPTLAAASTVSHRYAEQSSAPSTPAAGFGALYLENNRVMRLLDDEGLDIALAGVLATQTADVTIASTVTETTLLGTVVGTLTLPADSLEVGKTVRIVVRGFLSNTGTPNLTIRAKLGGTEVVGTGAIVTASGVSNVGFVATFDITLRTTGGSGTVVAAGAFEYNNGTIVNAVKTTTTTIDTTGSLAIDVTAEWGTSSASNTITCQIATIEILN